MKIRGTTITTPIARSAVADDKSVSNKPWSSKNTVDKLCPSFTESGSIVTCEPVEGYPLGVEWQTKNLINPTAFLAASSNTTLDGDVFTTNFASGALFINHKGSRVVFPAGQYTLTYVAVSETVNMNAYVYSTVDGSTIATKALGNHYNISKFSFTADVPFYLSFGGLSAGDNLGTYSFKLQLEKGTTATAYEPYAETATITRCGKNLCTVDTAELINKSMDVVLWSGSLSAPLVLRAKVSDSEFATPGSTFIQLKIDAEAQLLTPVRAVNGYKITSGTLTEVRLYNWCGGTGIANFQLETGTTATDFEPYNGGTFEPGEPIPAIQGVNTIFADAGLVTVKGKADPGALINKLTNAILSLGGNV